MDVKSCDICTFVSGSVSLHIRWISRFVHLIAGFPNFLRLTNIPSYGYTTICLSLMPVDMICFHLLVVVNQAAMIIR